MSINRRFSKSTLLLTLFLASASAGQLVQAEETSPITETTTAITDSNPTAPTEEAAAAIAPENTTTTVESSSQPAELSDITPEATSSDLVLSENVDQAAVNPVLRAADNTASPTEAETKEVLPVEGQTVDVRILSTTDLHTNLVNYDYYQDKSSQNLGLAKTAVLIEEAKAENGNVVLVDNGDTIQGTPLGTYKSIVDPVEVGEQHPMYTALTALGFDAGTLGNHEFNYGLDYLNKVIATAGMPLLNANVIDPETNKPIYQTHSILTKTFTDTTGNPVSLKVGITGIVPPQILSWDKAHLEGKVLVRDAVEALTELVPQIRQAGADIVLVLSHSGIGDDVYDKGEENVGYQIAGIPGVDAVVTGHSHAEFPAGGKGFYSRYAGVDDVNGLINGTPVTMGGKYGDHLGIIDLNLTFANGKWQTNTAKGSIRKIDTKSEAASETIVNLAKEAHEGTIAYVRQQVGTTTAPITSYFALVKDDPSVQIVNNAQIWYAKQELDGTPEADLPILSAAAPFKAGTRGDATAYTDIPAGAIAIKNVADLYLYDNVTAILKVTGADLKEWLEMSAGQFNQIDPSKAEPQTLVNPEFRTYNFDVIDGVTYAYDITQPQKYDRSGKVINEGASRVRDLKYQGKDVTADQEFIVVTNNYRANGTFPGVVNASLNKLLNLENRQAIINYILAEKTINPTADGNWTFTDSIKGLDLRFLTADKAKDLVVGAEDVIYLEPSTTSEGFGEFRFVYVAPKPVVVAQPTPQANTNQTSNLTDKDRQDIKTLVQTAYQDNKTKAQPSSLGLNTQQTGLALAAGKAKPTETNLPGSGSLSRVAKAAADKTLPNTGSQSSLLLSLLGTNLLGLAGILTKKAKKD